MNQLTKNEHNRMFEELQDELVHQLIESQVEQTPDAIAVVFEDRQLTYRELNIRANQLAHCLRKYQVGPEVLVGISLERSLESVVSILGILKAGGAYLFLDPTYPKERLAFILEDAQVGVLLIQEHLLAKLPEHEAKVICLNGENLEQTSFDTFFGANKGIHRSFRTRIRDVFNYRLVTQSIRNEFGLHDIN